MRRKIWIGVGLLLCAAAGVAQVTSEPTQSQLETLRAMLVELRQIRQDLHNSTVANQRAHILIYRMGVQAEAVRRSQEKLDEATQALAQLKAQQNNVAGMLKQEEDGVAQTEDPTFRKQLEASIARLKAEQEMETHMEQEAQATFQEAQDQFRIEGARLGQLQDELDALDRTLQEASRR